MKSKVHASTSGTIWKMAQKMCAASFFLHRHFVCFSPLFQQTRDKSGLNLSYLKWEQVKRMKIVWLPGENTSIASNIDRGIADNNDNEQMSVTSKLSFKSKQVLARLFSLPKLAIKQLKVKNLPIAHCERVSPMKLHFIKTHAGSNHQTYTLCFCNINFIVQFDVAHFNKRKLARNRT